MADAEEHPSFVTFDLEWADVHEPGSYIHIPTGLLVRVFPEEIVDGRLQSRVALVGRVAQLSRSPQAPVTSLRIVAARIGYRVKF